MPGMSGTVLAAETTPQSHVEVPMTFTNVRKLGAITPLGGLCFLAGWGAIAWNALVIVD